MFILKALASLFLVTTPIVPIAPLTDISETFLEATGSPDTPQINEDNVVATTTPEDTSTTTTPIIAPPSEDKEENIACSCIKWARSQGLNIPYGTDADELIANNSPQVGGGIIFTYGHIGVIRGFLKDGFWIQEANKSRCKITYRFVLYGDKTIKGFYKI